MKKLRRLLIEFVVNVETLTSNKYYKLSTVVTWLQGRKTLRNVLVNRRYLKLLETKAGTLTCQTSMESLMYANLQHVNQAKERVAPLKALQHGYLY